MYRAAALRDCVSELSGVEGAQAAALRSRAHLRLGDAQRGLEATAQAYPLNDRESGELALLRGISLARLGEPEQSAGALVDAQVFGISAGDAGLEAEIAFYRGLIAFGEGDLVEARRACMRAFECISTPQPPFAPASGGDIPVSHVVSRTQELAGLIEAADGRYRDWLSFARQAISTLDECAVTDVYQQAFAIANLSVLARDFGLREESHDLARRFEALPYTQDVALQKFRAIHSLSWSAALSGARVDAYRRLRTASETAASAPEHVLTANLRAIIARESGHHAMAAEEIEHSLKLSSSFDWEYAPGDTRNALLEIAHVAASIAPARGREMMTKYRNIQNGMNASFAARIEPRTRAEEAYAEGVLLRAEGRVDASTERLAAAFKIWDDTGYEWRAAMAAVELAELRAGDVFRTVVRRELVRRPDSVFATRARLVA